MCRDLATEDELFGVSGQAWRPVWARGGVGPPPHAAQSIERLQVDVAVWGCDDDAFRIAGREEAASGFRVCAI